MSKTANAGERRKGADTDETRASRRRAVQAQERLEAASSEAEAARAARDVEIRFLLAEGWSLRAVADVLGVRWTTVRYADLRGRERA